MDDVIQRMKAADAEDARHSYEIGKRAGTEWAKNGARPKQLRRLAEQGDILSGEPDAYGWAGVLFAALNGDHNGDRAEIAAFWETAVGDDGAEMIEDTDFAQGIIDGALEVWQAVQARV